MLYPAKFAFLQMHQPSSRSLAARAAAGLLYDDRRSEIQIHTMRTSHVTVRQLLIPNPDFATTLKCWWLGKTQRSPAAALQKSPAARQVVASPPARPTPHPPP